MEGTRQIEREQRLAPSEYADDSLERILRYRNEEVLHKFLANFPVGRSEAEQIFADMLMWLWISNCATQNGGPRLSIEDSMLVVDEMWHTFILSTEDYESFCKENFGKVLHHVPIKASEKMSLYTQAMEDPGLFNAERRESLKQMYNYVAEYLGHEVLLRWFSEYRKKFPKHILREINHKRELGIVTNNARTADSFLNRIRYQLSIDGMAHVDSLASLDDFLALSEKMGHIMNISDIKPNPSIAASFAGTEKMDLHTDHPAAEIVAWYCVRASQEFEPTNCLDLRILEGFLTSEDLHLLNKIEVRIPNSSQRAPLVSLRQSSLAYYYAPWLVEEPREPELAAALGKFTQAIDSYSRYLMKSVSLREGEALFIDNKRVMHGRGKLNEKSRRFLKRVWIKLD
jgi:hypothetical protein